MRDFAKSPEPPGHVAGSADGRTPLPRPAPPRPPAALRPALRSRRRVDQLGGPQGSEPRSGPQVAGRQGRGPSVRLRVVRGDHPQRLRHGRRRVVGRRLVGTRSGVPGRAAGGEGDRRWRVQVRAHRAQAARPLPARAHGQAWRERRPVVADAQEGRRGGGEMGSGGSSPVCAQRPHQRGHRHGPARQVAGSDGRRARRPAQAAQRQGGLDPRQHHSADHQPRQGADARVAGRPSRSPSGTSSPTTPPSPRG